MAQTRLYSVNQTSAKIMSSVVVTRCKNFPNVDYVICDLIYTKLTVSTDLSDIYRPTSTTQQLHKFTHSNLHKLPMTINWSHISEAIVTSIITQHIRNMRI